MRGAIAVNKRPRGFTFLGLLFAVAVISATLGSAGIVWHTAQQREKERDLLFIGNQFRQAIGYYFNSPGQAKKYPQSLEDLLRDPRVPGTQRYLRKLYNDPVTGRAEWGLVKLADDRIIGVYSLSDKQPIKQSNFSIADNDFEGKKKYSEWSFVYRPKPSPIRPSNKPQAEAMTAQ
jgi:type II secretory pathway pseudopilin PulG